MSKNENGFGAVEVLIVIVIACLVIAVGWLFYDRQKDIKSTSESSSAASRQVAQTQAQTQDTEEAQKTQSAKTTITPFLGSKSFTVSLPEGWSRDTMISEVSPVYSKMVNGTKYMISFVNGEVDATDTNPTGYSTVGFLNPEGYKNTVIKSVTTSKGSRLYVVKSTNELSGGGILLLSSSQPNPKNSYIKYEGQNLGIVIKVAEQQSDAEINFTAAGVDAITNDLESIATSLGV